MTRRATFFDDTMWQPETMVEKQRIGATYCVAAHRAGVSDLEPGVEWLANYLSDLRRKKNAQVAQRHSRAISYHMLSHGVEDLTLAPLVEAVLHCEDSTDPFAINFAASDVPLRFRLRARAFSDQGYSEKMLTEQERWKRLYLARCEQKLVADPFAPPGGFFEQWFEEFGSDHAAATVRNMRNAISRFFRDRRVADATRTPGVDRILDGIRRSKPPIDRPPVSPEQRLELVRVYGSVGLGLRNRVLLLFIAFTPLSIAEIVLVRCSDCTVTEEGVVVASRDPRNRDVFIGRHDHPDLDVLQWLPKLKAVMRTGPLFQSSDYSTLSFTGHAMEPKVVVSVVGRAATKAGVPRYALQTRLKRLFETEVGDARGELVAAHFFRRSRIRRDSSQRRRVDSITMKARGTTSRVHS